MFDFLFNPQGRISRKGYVLGYVLPSLGASFVAGGLLGPAGALLASLFFLWPGNVSVPVRRFHDLGITGKMQLGFIGLQLLAALMMFQGMMGDLPAEEVNLEEFLSTASPMEGAADPGRFRLGQTLLYGVAIAQFALFALVPGQAGKNRYGNDPLESGRGFAD